MSPLTFDFNKLEVTLEMEGKKLTLSGNVEAKECKVITGKRLQKFMTKGKGANIANVFHPCYVGG